MPNELALIQGGAAAEEYRARQLVATIQEGGQLRFTAGALSGLSMGVPTPLAALAGEINFTGVSSAVESPWRAELLELQTEVVQQGEQIAELLARVEELEAILLLDGADFPEDPLSIWLRENEKFVTEHLGEHFAFDDDAHDLVAHGPEYSAVRREARDKRPTARLLFDVFR